MGCSARSHLFISTHYINDLLEPSVVVVVVVVGSSVVVVVVVRSSVVEVNVVVSKNKKKSQNRKMNKSLIALFTKLEYSL